ncbi:S8 family serine peptidase [Argonema galeatum]|uniref:S8 family serine peptidase n=1 Tax=Argonema galeatum TaxID=2942762 RepID=UPI0020135218|nr:S8 family serine peptidase [Argonema galeatum]MCL1464370.1 S8 family serine peptidase [Argonema galeatum A003/A1]
MSWFEKGAKKGKQPKKSTKKQMYWPGETCILEPIITPSAPVVPGTDHAINSLILDFHFSLPDLHLATTGLIDAPDGTIPHVTAGVDSHGVASTSVDPIHTGDVPIAHPEIEPLPYIYNDLGNADFCPADPFNPTDPNLFPVDPGVPGVPINPNPGAGGGTIGFPVDPSNPPPIVLPLDPPGGVRFDFKKADQPIIGVIDTGFSGNNPDIDYSNVTLGHDYIDNDANPLLQNGEGNEHGTHVLGVIAAKQDNGIGIDGINDKVPIWVSRATGSGHWADSLIEFVNHAKESGQPNAVVNLSLDLTQVNPDGSVTTRYEFTPAERAALEYARQNHVLIVAAAGNDGGVMSVLGQASQEFDNIITVGSADGTQRADYSSYGYGLDVMADGGTTEHPVLSTVGDGVGTMAGTSVAAAEVTGAVSQVWAANPGLNYRQVIDILEKTARDLETAGWDAQTGFGLVDIEKAVELAKATTPEEYNPEKFSTPTTWDGEGNVTPSERAVATQFLGKYYEWDSYTIKSEDTLSAIALRTMGSSSATYYNFIAQKNGIANPNLIYPGQTILIPRQVSAPVNLNNTVGYDGTSTIQSYIDTLNRNGGKTILGSPTNNVHSWQSGYTQDFSGGSEGKGAIMKANGSTNSYWVGSDFWSKFLEVGSAGGILHYPTSDRYSTNSGWRQNFQGGAILKSSKGIFPVFGGIGAHYLNSENGEKGRLGFPISGEIAIGNGVVIQNFENGRIVYGDGPTRTEMNSQPPNLVTSVTINGYTVNGDFYSVFKNYQGTLGNPISGVVNHANGVTEQLFQNGSIISSKYGTFPLYGDIRQTYLNNSGLNGWLGAPTSAEVPQGNGVVKQTFEGGYIIWNGKTATAYRTGSNNPVQPITSTPTPASVQNIILKPGASNLNFSRGQKWITSTGYKFSFQQDGNLVLYNPQGRAIWATGTFGTNVDRFSVQSDGNVVLYDHGKAVWATDTAGNPGASFAIQNDGNLVVYSSNGKPLFNTGTYGGRTGTFTASQNWLNKHSNGGGSGKYYPQLASLTKANWNYQSKDNLFFDGKPGNGESLSAVKQVYSDLSNGIFGSYKAMTAGYFDNTNYSGKHYGIDMAGLAGNSVKTVVGGTATLVQNIAGNYFIGIKGDDGNLWIYGHLENYSKGIIGKRVEAGTKIGTVFDGAYFNGNWMAQHLHLEVHQGHTYNRAKSISPLEAYWKLRNL